MTIEQAKRSTAMVRKLRAENKRLRIALLVAGSANLNAGNFFVRDVQSIIQNALHPRIPFKNFLRKISRG